MTNYLYVYDMAREETGNYYYGARYYDPKISVWLSVDPMASERSWLTPYNFVQNNPLMRVDPDGMLDTDPPCENTCGLNFYDQNGKLFAQYETDKVNLDVTIEIDAGILEAPINVNEILFKYIDMDDVDIIGVGGDWDFTFGMGGGRSVETAIMLDGKDIGKQYVYNLKRQNAGLNGSFGVYVFAADFQNYDDQYLKASDYEGRSFGLIANLPGGLGLSKTWATPDQTANFGWESYFDKAQRNWSGFSLGVGFGGGAQWSRQSTTLIH